MNRSERTSTADAPEGDVVRVASVAAAIASIEYYDFFIYATAAALVFPTLFFPDQGAVTGVLLSFATFGVGFLARPVGGIVFGHFGDLIGRKKTLVVALMMMGVVSTAIGLMPTHATIGIAAPILLVACGSCRGSRSVARWAGSCSWQWRPPPRTGGASSAASPRSVRRAGSCWPTWPSWP